MKFTFIINEWPFRKLNNKVVIVISGRTEKSLILDSHGDYETVPTVKLKEADKEFVTKNILDNSLLRELCVDENLIEVRHEESNIFLTYASKHM